MSLTITPTLLVNCISVLPLLSLVIVLSLLARVRVVATAGDAQVLVLPRHVLLRNYVLSKLES